MHAAQGVWAAPKHGHQWEQGVGARSRWNRPFEFPRLRCATPEEVQDTSPVVVFSVDGKGVPMRKADLHAATRQAAEAHRAPRGSRGPQGERNHTKRMATVATVYTIAPWVRTPANILRALRPAHLAATARPRPEAKRVWASLAQPMADVIQQACEEAKRRDLQRTKQWVALVDGHPTQLRLLYEAAAEYGVELRVVLDLIHVLGYLWPAAKVFYPTAPLEAETWVTTRLEHLLRGRSCQLAAPLRRTATAVVYLAAADKDRGLTRRPSQEQKGLDKRTLIASQQPFHPW